MRGPSAEQKKQLVETLKQRHGPEFGDLQIKGRQCACCLESLPGFQLVEATPRRRHVGRVIVDGVLQVGHRYGKQVRPAVEHIVEHNEANTIMGFIELIEHIPLVEIIGWKEESTRSNLLSVARFFQREGVNSYNDLCNWLEPEGNRDKLLAKNSGLKGPAFSIGYETADYFRVLVGHWDAVAVDTGMVKLLAKTGVFPISTRKWYLHRRTVIQLAALALRCYPLDLDSSLYRYCAEGSEHR